MSKNDSKESIGADSPQRKSSTERLAKSRAPPETGNGERSPSQPSDPPYADYDEDLAEIKSMALCESIEEYVDNGEQQHIPLLLRPKPNWWVRVRPGQNFQMLFGVVRDEDRGIFVISQQVLPKIEELCDTVRRRVFRLGITSTGVRFIWATPLSDDNAWNKTHCEIATQAEREWVFMQSDRACEQYRSRKGLIDKRPEWPSEPFVKTIARAVPKEFRIVSMDHPFVQKLQGLAY